MNNRILNEVKRNRELMGLNESEVDEQLGTAIRKGIEKGKEFVKDKIIDPIKDRLDGEEKEVEKTPVSTENEKQPISTEDFKQTVIKIYDDHITIESETPSSDRAVAQKIITSVAEEKGYGEQKSRELIPTENGGYKIIATFDKK